LGYFGIWRCRPSNLCDLYHKTGELDIYVFQIKLKSLSVGIKALIFELLGLLLKMIQILDGNEAYWWLTQVEMRKWVAKRKCKLKLHLETEKKRVFDSRTLKVWSYRLPLIHHHSQNCWI
jgi:hypothetical protein